MIHRSVNQQFAVTALTLVATFVFAGFANAQESASNSRSAVALEEIIVTATRRAQSIQDVPLSVSALTNADLQRMGADNIQDYYRSIPNFAVIDRGPGGRQYSIRGVSAGIVQQGAATVGVYIDEMPVTSNGRQADLSVYDLDRIEVLRGPQGTLFGEGSVGGTVRMITPEANTEAFDTDVSVDFSSTKEGGTNSAVSGMVNFALSDNVALRLTGYYRDNSGYIDRVPEPLGRTFDFATLVGAPAGAIPPVISTGPIPGRNDINGEETTGGRASLLWRATDNFEVEVNLLTQNSEFDGRNTKIQSLGELETNFYVAETVSDEMNLANLTMTYDFGSVVLLSSTSLFDRHNRGVADTDALGDAVFPGLSLFGTATDTDWFQDQISQEFRLVSQGDGKLDWTAGFFYIDKDNGVDQILIDEEAVFVSLTNILVAPFAISDPRQILDLTGNFEETQIAVYGEIDYHFNDQWSGTVGLRYYDYEQTNIDTNNDINILGLGLPDASFENNGDGTNLKVGLSYRHSEDVLFYASAAEGFRLGGTNNAPGTPAEFRTYDSDSLWSYEIGNKMTLSDGRIQLNSAIYYVDWSDIQLAVPLGFSLATVNAGQARIIGAEVELVARPNENWDLFFTIGVNDGELSEDAPGANDPGNPNPGFEGDRLPGTPDLNAAASIQYNWPMGVYSGFFRVDYNYTGDVTTTFNDQSVNLLGQSSHYKLDAYSLLNLRLGISTEHWTTTLYIDNATDERADVLTDNASLVVRVTRNRPLTAGLKVQFNY